jgi:hypothetical protein
VTPLAVFLGDRGGPDEWDVNPDAHLTAVVAVKGTVAARFGFVSVGETDVRAVRQALKKAIDSK